MSLLRKISRPVIRPVLLQLSNRFGGGNVPAGARKTEDGTVRRTENGTIRKIET